jgi:hypothetical protein
MTLTAYLRRQADHCARLSRSCYDLSVAEDLRTIADELRAKAAELESGSPLASMPSGTQRQAPPT